MGVSSIRCSLRCGQGRVAKCRHRISALPSEETTRVDNRFGWQTVFMAALGVLVLFGDAIRAAAGLWSQVRASDYGLRNRRAINPPATTPTRAATTLTKIHVALLARPS